MSLFNTCFSIIFFISKHIKLIRTLNKDLNRLYIFFQTDPESDILDTVNETNSSHDAFVPETAIMLRILFVMQTCCIVYMCSLCM